MHSDYFKRLYHDRPHEYERLVQHEDYQGNLLAALNRIYPLAGATVVEFGAGTGRLTRQVAPLAKWLWAFDLTPPMLKESQHHLPSNQTNWRLGLADNRVMPLPPAVADVAVEGWSFLQLMVWQGDAWQRAGGQAISELLRVVRPGGMAIMIETLGTGAVEPVRAERFRPMYEYMEKDWGFTCTWIRTDFRFAARADIHQLIVPFFGKAILDTLIESPQGIIVPECTGLWRRRV